jgi:hypothetical protein
MQVGDSPFLKRNLETIAQEFREWLQGSPFADAQPVTHIRVTGLI